MQFVSLVVNPLRIPEGSHVILQSKRFNYETIAINLILPLSTKMKSSYGWLLLYK